MEKLNQWDYGVILVYLSCLVALGLYLKRKASASLEDYFLGNRKIPWWLMGVSGMASFLDITGTVLIVSFLFVVGPRGLFVEFRGGAVLVLAVYLLWTGKWHHRSGCMTGAEWMIYRFGEGPGGNAARIMRAVSEIIFTAGMLIYMAKGVGLFLSMFLPFPPVACSTILIGVAALYTMMSGFYGVVFTDLFQSLIILVAVIWISALAMTHVTDGQAVATLSAQVLNTDQWTSTFPHWEAQMPEGYEAHRYLAIFALFYILRNVLYGMGSGDDPKYFGARNERECGTLTFLWTWLMMFRWPMMMGFAVLGLVLVRDQFPDQAVLKQAEAAITQHVLNTSQGDPSKPKNEIIPKSEWDGLLSRIANAADDDPELGGLRKQLKGILKGDRWEDKLKMVSYEGSVNPEKILPAVIFFMIPRGLRGLLLIALIAASMSTFDSTVNRGAGFFTRDLYQRYFRRKAGNRELIYATWFFIAIMAVTGLLLGNYVKNIDHIWGWITMSLGVGMLVPLVLRFHWWRFTGGGFAIGMTFGLTGALLQGILWPKMHMTYQFSLMLGIGLAGSLIGTYLTRPTDPDVLAHFYRTTRPFGLWGPLKKTLSPDMRAAMTREHRNDLLALPFTLTWQATLFLLPMLIIIHAYTAFFITLVIFLTGLGGMYLFWYRNLPPADLSKNNHIDSQENNKES